MESFDFGQWLKRNFTVNDFIIVSLDIEGAEYEVLDKMLLDGTIRHVDRFYIEFHASDFNRFVEKEKELIEELNNLGILTGHDSVDNMIERGGWIDTIRE